MKSAVAFWQNPANRKRPLDDYAMHLAAAANDRLAAIGVPRMNPDATENAAVGGIFHQDLWVMQVNAAALAGKGARTVGDLTAEAAASIAQRVYHEARHAEQVFRLARIEAAKMAGQPADKAAEHIAQALMIDAHAAEKAAAKPWKENHANPRDTREATAWFESTYGIHRIYNRVVVGWLGEAAQTVDWAWNADPNDPDAAHERIGGRIAWWRSRDGYVSFLREHTQTLRRRIPSLQDNVVLANLSQIGNAASDLFNRWDTLSARWHKASSEAKLRELKDLAVPLAELDGRLRTAYADQAVEDDARATGSGARSRFLETAGRQADRR